MDARHIKRFLAYSQEVETLVAVNKQKMEDLEDALRRLHDRVRVCKWWPIGEGFGVVCVCVCMCVSCVWVCMGVVLVSVVVVVCGASGGPRVTSMGEGFGVVCVGVHGCWPCRHVPVVGCRGVWVGDWALAC